MTSNLQSLGLPDEADYRSLIEEVGSDVVRRRLREQGVFVAGPSDELARFVSRFIFPDTWYAQLFKVMEPEHNHTTLTGVRGSGLGLEELAEMARSRIGKDIQLKHPAVITSVVYQPDQNEAVVSVSYRRRRPKRSKFYQSEPLTMDIICQSLVPGVVEMCSYTEVPTDPLILREVSEHVLGDAGAQLHVLDIEALDAQKRVSLFDTIIDEMGTNSWRVQDVVELTITRERSTPAPEVEEEFTDEPVDDDDGDSRSLTAEETKILRTAILEGRNLRQLDLVAQLVEDGYYFSGMEFWAFNPSPVRPRAEEVKVRIDFKKRPKALVVHASKTRIFLTDGKPEESSAIPSELTKEVVRHFWNQVHIIFDGLHGEIKAKARRVVRRRTGS